MAMPRHRPRLGKNAFFCNEGVSHQRPNSARLLQLRVLRLGFLQDGDVGVGVFPEAHPKFTGAD